MFELAPNEQIQVCTFKWKYSEAVTESPMLV